MIFFNQDSMLDKGRSKFSYYIHGLDVLGILLDPMMEWPDPSWDVIIEDVCFRP